MDQQFTTTSPFAHSLFIPPACNKSHLLKANTKNSSPALFPSKNRGKRRDSIEKSQLDRVDRLHRQAKTCLAAVAKAVKTTIRPTFEAIRSRFRESYEILQKQDITSSLIDKYKYTTLSYSKNGLSCRPFHRECFYREKTPVHTTFLQVLPSSEAKNASRIPLGCLSEASKMPSWRDSQAAERPVYDRRSLLYRRQHEGLQGLKGKCICHTQPGKQLGIGTRFDRETSKNNVQTSREQFVLASLHPYNLTLLHYYVFHFPLLLFGLSPFRSHQNNTPKNEAGSDAEEDFRSSSAQRKRLEKFFQRAKSGLCGKQKASTLSLF